MIRRIQLTFLALFVSVWAMASETSVKNADGVEIWYDFDSNTMTASVTYRGEAYYTYYNEYIGNVVIPSKVTYEDEEYSVTKIGDWVFYGCNSLTSITIPESVTEIGEMTFIFCSSLTSITLHEGLTEIGSDAFYGCSSLTSITIPESVTEIGSNAFLDCSSLTSITIPKGVTKIGDGAFYNCSSLTSVTISEGVTEIGNEAFRDCSSLTSITLPEGVTSIGSSVFSYCSSLTSITLPESVTSIGSYAFSNCISLTSITIPEGVTEIRYDAFGGCYKLYEVYNKSNLTITAGSSENGGVAYYAKIVYTDESGESKLKTVGDYLFYVDEDNIELLEYLGDETAITLPSDYEGKNYKIGDNAFYGCGSLTSITLPEGVTSIGENAFSYCYSLISITIPEGVTEIGDNAFYGCGSLTSIDVALDNNSYTSINGVLFSKDKTILIKYPEVKKDVTSYAIPENVTEIAKGAFSGCRSLTSITIPKGVTEIGEDAFSGCGSLTSITLPEGVTSIGENAFFYCYSLISITIPESVTSIGEDAFRGCSSLTSVTIPKNVTSIGEDAFEGCRSLTSITIPKGVTSIGDNVFRDCSSLTSITIPEGLTEIGDGAFEDCRSLTSITIPEGVISIGEYAFRGCDRLYEVYNKSNLTITAGSSENGGVAYHAKNVYTDESGESKLKTVGDYIFYVDEDNIELFAYIGDETAITLPSDYEGKNYKIGDNAFRDCSSLTSITIPESVTEIGEGAFAYCSGLTNVTIGEGVTKIGEAAFYGCSNHDVYNRSKLYLTLGSEENGYVAYHANNVNNIYFETTDSYIFYVKEDDVELIKHIGGFDGADVMINEYVEDENIYSTDFSDGQSLIGWGGSATRTVVNEEMVLTNPEASDYWAVQFAYDHVEPFVVGRKYVISFKVKGSVAGTISAGLQNINGYTSAGEFGGIDVTTDWKEVRLTCTCTDGAATRLVFSVGTFVGDLYIDDIRFCSLFYKLSLPAKYKERVYDISRNAFEDDTYMTEIEIPEGVMAIGKDAMKGTALYEDESNWENGLLYVDGCLVAAKSSEVSELCVIEDGVRIIADNTFENITTLKNVIISADVRRIGNAAFNDCSGLTSITSMSTTPPEIGNKETFCNVDKSIPVYVPKQSVEAYKSAEYWKDFTNIQGIDDVTPITDVVADSVSIRLIGNSLIVEGAESYAVYALSGQCLGKVESLERGVYIVVADGVSKRIVVK